MLRVFTPLSLLVVLTVACGSSTTPPDEAPKKSDIKGLITDDVRLGDGEEATFGRNVLVHYTGWLYDETRSRQRGREFDNSRDRNEPHGFKLGAGEVIRAGTKA